VRYVLEGSVRKASGRVRITAQLIEAETGAHLWAERFDGSLEAIFDLQDQVAVSVAGVIEPTLPPRMATKMAENLRFSSNRREIRRETDCPLEGTGFELLVRGRVKLACRAPTAAKSNRSAKPLSMRIGDL